MASAQISASVPAFVLPRLLGSERSRDVGDVSRRGSASSCNRPATPIGSRREPDGAKRRARQARRPDVSVRPTPARRQGRRQGFAHKVESIADPDEPLRTNHGTRDHFRAGIPESDQMPREIPAIDRGNVFRFQRAKIERVIPIVEMTAEALEPAHRFKRRFQPLDRLQSFRASRNHAPPPPTKGKGRDSSAMSGGQAPARDLLENCPAEACDLPP